MFETNQIFHLKKNHSVLFMNRVFIVHFYLKIHGKGIFFRTSIEKVFLFKIEIEILNFTCLIYKSLH